MGYTLLQPIWGADVSWNFKKIILNAATMGRHSEIFPAAAIVWQRPEVGSLMQIQKPPGNRLLILQC